MTTSTATTATTATTAKTPEEVLRLSGYVVGRCRARANSDGYTSDWYETCYEDAVQTAALAYYEYQNSPIECGVVYYMCRAVGREAYKWSKRGKPEYIAANRDFTLRQYDIDKYNAVYDIYKNRVFRRCEFLASAIRKDFRYRVMLAVNAVLVGKKIDSPRAMTTARAIIRQAIEDIRQEEKKCINNEFYQPKI